MSATVMAELRYRSDRVWLRETARSRFEMQNPSTRSLIAACLILALGGLGVVFMERNDPGGDAAIGPTEGRVVVDSESSSSLPPSERSSSAPRSKIDTEDSVSALEEVEPEFGDWGATVEDMEEAVRQHVRHFVGRRTTTLQIAGWRSESGGECTTLDRSKYGPRVEQLPEAAFESMMREVDPLQSTLKSCAESAYQLAYAELQQMEVAGSLVATSHEAHMLADRKSETCGVGRGVRMTVYSVVTIGDRYFPFVFCGADYPEIKDILDAASAVKARRNEIVERVLSSNGV